MKAHPIFGAVLVMLLALLLPGGALLWASSATPETAAPGLKSSPVMFIENVGQWDDGARFQVWGGPAGTMWLAEDAIWITVLGTEETSGQVDWEPSRSDKVIDPRLRRLSEDQEQPAPRRGVNIKVSFVGANPHPRIETFNRLDTTISYFFGADPDLWRPDVPVWEGVRYVDLYPGIDLEISNQDGQLIQRLEAQPGADLGTVQLRVEGADTVAVDGNWLRLSTAVGERFLRLLQATGANAEANVQMRAVQVFDVSTPFAALSRSGRSPFTASHSPIDNASDLLYGTFLGGYDYDPSFGLAVDGAGNAYVTGTTNSSDFPTTPGAFDTSYNGNSDAFVAKLDLSGSALTYATFLGGSSNADEGKAIAVDDTGSAFVTGYTGSSSFPTTSGAFDASYNGGEDAFLAKLSPDGSTLAYATFLGGTSQDRSYAIGVDALGSAYVTGYTLSTNFPATPGAFDTSSNGAVDAFVAKLSPAGSALGYATFMGGGNYDDGHAIAVDAVGSAYVTGQTFSSDFPTTPGAFDPSYNGGISDAFVVKLNPDGSALTYATFLGSSGSGEDNGWAIAVDEIASAYVTGVAGCGFPTTPGAFSTSCHGENDAFVAKVNPDGSALTYSTFLGGSDNDESRGIAVDGGGSASVTGYTSSINFPTTANAFDASYNGGQDAFVVKLNSAASELVYATFLGGGNEETGNAVATDAEGTAYVTGYTYSDDFPTTPGAFDTSYNGGSRDSFVARLAMGAGILPPPTPTSTATPTATPTVTPTPTATPLAFLQLPSTGGAPGAVVHVPIRAGGMESLTAADITVTFDAAVLNALGASLGDLTPGWSLAANTTVPGEVRLAMAGTGGPIGDAGVLAYLEFDVVGAPAVTSTLHFSHVSLNDGSLPVTTADGTFLVMIGHQVSGAVDFWRNNASLQRVLLSLDGDQTYSAVTSATGVFTLTGIVAGDYELTPAKSDDVNGISAYDASLALRHSAGLINLNGYEATAADVNRNGVITSQDASYILQKAADLIALPFPNADGVWEFDPPRRSYTNLNNNLDSQNFTGVLLGDVSGNWAATLLAQSRGADAMPSTTGLLASQLVSATLHVPHLGVDPGEQTTAPLTLALDDGEVYSADLVISYDPSVATVTDVAAGSLVTGWSLEANTGVPGIVRVALAGAQAVTGSGEMLRITFQTVGQAAQRTPLTFVQGDLNEGVIHSILQNGSISICLDFVEPAGFGLEELISSASLWGLHAGDPGWDARFDLDQDGDIDIGDIGFLTSFWSVCN